MVRSLSSTRVSPLDSRPCSLVLPALLCALLTGCAGALPEEPGDAPEWETEPFPLRSNVGQGNNLDNERDSTNGLGTNGLGTNGLGTNGLGTNGLGTSGLSISNLNSSTFVAWFNQNPALSDMVMQYVVGCAAPVSAKLGLDQPRDPGRLPVAWQPGPDAGLGEGAPATELEQQVITACLAAHTNKYRAQGAHLPAGAGCHGHAHPRGPLGVRHLPSAGGLLLRQPLPKRGHLRGQ